MIGNAKDSRTELWIFIFLGLVIIAYRLIVLYHFGFIYTDSDQSIMWLGAKHFSQGLFYEPRFYGQAYNTMMEAFLAVPLIKMGVPLYKALPAITTLLSLLPVFLLSIITYLRNSKNAGILVLCIYLALPLEYSLITTLSRGFITGIAFASLVFLFLYRFESKAAYFFVFLISMLAYSINANSIILSLPICMIFFLKNYKNRHFYIFSGTGIILGLAIHLMVASFYAAHPYYNFHKYHFEFSLDYLIRGTSDLNKFFNYNTPVFWNHGWLLLVMLLIPAAIYYKKKKFDFSFVSLVIPLMIIGTMLLSKVHEGTGSVFFSYARMYLAVPIVLMLMVSFISINQKRWLYVFISASLVFCIVNITTLKQQIRKCLTEDHVVSVLKTEIVNSECSKLLSISKQNNIELIVVLNHWYYDVYNYACPACMGEFPKTLRPEYERRTWRLIEDENKIYSNILIIDMGRSFDKEYENITKVDGEQGFYIIKDNKLATMVLFNKLNITVRKYR